MADSVARSRLAARTVHQIGGFLELPGVYVPKKWRFCGLPLVVRVIIRSPQKPKGERMQSKQKRQMWLRPELVVLISKIARELWSWWHLLW